MIPFFISSFVILLDQRVSFFFIEKCLSLSDLGNDSVGVALVDLWVFLPTAIAASVFPTIVTAYSNNKLKYGTRIQYLSDVLTSEGRDQAPLWGSLPQRTKSVEVMCNYQNSGFFNLGRIKWMTLENRPKEWLWINTVCLVLNFDDSFQIKQKVFCDVYENLYISAKADSENPLAVPILENSQLIYPNDFATWF